MTAGGGGEIDRAELERRLGLDVPVHVQYGRWMGGILLRGDLGQPLLRSEPVGQLIAGRLPTTIELGLVALVVGVLIGVPIGIYSAVRQDTMGDYFGRSFAILGLATPNFWLATIILVFPAIWWGWSPPLRLVRLSDDFVRHFAMFIVPGLILGTYLAASIMRMTRTMMLEVLRQDYIRTAWAKGLRERLVILRHVIKNALIPVVTLVGLQIPIIVGGFGHHGADVRHPGPGTVDDRCPVRSRLSDHLRHQSVLRRRGHGHQPAGRRAVRLPGPARPLRMRSRHCHSVMRKTMKPTHGDRPPARIFGSSTVTP